MATVSYNASVSWTDAMAAADFNALANGAGILSTASVLDNTTNKYLYCDLSFLCVTSTWAVSAGGHLAIYMLPIASDGSTYPNSNNGSTAADYPGIQHYVGAMDFRDATLAHVGGLEGIRISPTKYKFYVVNKTGAALPSSSTNMTLKFSTYTESVA